MFQKRIKIDNVPICVRYFTVLSDFPMASKLQTSEFLYFASEKSLNI